MRNILVAHSALAGTDRESTGLIRLRDFTKFRVGELGDARWQELLVCSSGLPRLYDALAHELMRLRAAERFVDKINVAVWRLHYLRRYFPQASFVNIVRDGRDGLCSARRHPNVRQSKSVRSFARYWTRCVALPEKILPEGQLRQIRYEDFVVDPEGVLGKVMEFIGVPLEPEQLSVEHYTDVSSLKKRAVHLNLAKPITASSVGRWRSELTEEEIRTFEEHAGGALRQWGYAS